MIRTNVLQFGTCISTTFTVKELLEHTTVNRIDPDHDGNVTGSQRELQRSNARKIKQAISSRNPLVETKQPLSLFTSPLFFNVDLDGKDPLSVKSDEKLRQMILEAKPENLDGQTRTETLRMLIEECKADGNLQGIMMYNMMEVRVEVYFNLPDFLKKMLFLRINYYIKPVSADTSLLFLQQIYKDAPETLSPKELVDARVASVTYDMCRSKVFNHRVKTVDKNVKTGPSFMGMYSAMESASKQINCLKHIEDADDQAEALFDVMQTGWKALASKWDHLNDADIWETLSHNNVIVVGNELIVRAINDIVFEGEYPQLNMAKAKQWFEIVLPVVMKALVTFANGNPLVQARNGGKANEYSSAAGKGDLLDYVRNGLCEVADKKLKLA